MTDAGISIVVKGDSAFIVVGGVVSVDVGVLLLLGNAVLC